MSFYACKYVEITWEVIQDWKNTNLSDVLTGLHFIIIIQLYLPFLLVFYASMPSLEPDPDQQQSYLTHSSNAKLQSWLSGPAGVRESPHHVSAMPHPLPRPTSENNHRTLLRPEPPEQPSFPSVAGSSVLRAKGAFSQHQTSAGNTQTCFPLSTDHMDLMLGARDFSCGPDVMAESYPAVFESWPDARLLVQIRSWQVFFHKWGNPLAFLKAQHTSLGPKSTHAERSRLEAVRTFCSEPHYSITFLLFSYQAPCQVPAATGASTQRTAISGPPFLQQVPSRAELTQGVTPLLQTFGTCTSLCYPI